MGEVGTIPEAEAVIGSIYLAPEEMPEPSAAVLNFQAGLKNCLSGVAPAVIDFQHVIKAATGQPDKSLTATCSESISRKVNRASANRLYTPNRHTATEVATLNELLISRTSIAETSAHQVFFAVLTDGSRRLRVAVKPFDKEPDKAITESTNTQLARSRGLKTFRPIGFLVHEDIGYTITERQDDIEPMDNAEWSAALLDPERHPGMLDDLRKVGPTLARVQAKNCFHGDVQLKNIVITQSGAVHFIDWEAATFLPERHGGLPGSEKGHDLVLSKTTRDLKVLFGSLARSVEDKGVGLLDNLTPAAQWAYFRELIMTPYLEERLFLADQDEVADAESLVTDLGYIEQEAYGYIMNGELYDSLARMRRRAA